MCNCGGICPLCSGEAAERVNYEYGNPNIKEKILDGVPALNREMGDGGCVQAKPNLENQIDTMKAQPKTQSPKDSIENDVTPINCDPDGKSSGSSGDGNTQKGIGEGEAAGPNCRVLAFKTKLSLGEMNKNFLNSEMGDGGCVQAKLNLENKIDTMEAQPKAQSPKDSIGNDVSLISCGPDGKSSGSSGDGNTQKGIGEGEAAGPNRRVLAFRTKISLGEMYKNFLNREMGDGGCVQAKPNLENKIDTMEAKPKAQSPKDSIGNDVSLINCGPDGKSSGSSGDGNTQKGIGEGEAAGPNRRVLAFRTKISLGEMYKNFLNREMGDGGCVQAKPNLENKIDTMEAQLKTQSPKDSIGNDVSPINCGPDDKSSGSSGDGNTQKGIRKGKAAGPNRRVLAFKTKLPLGEMNKNFLKSKMGDGGCVQAKPSLENKIDTMEVQPKTQSPKDSIGNDVSPINCGPGGKSSGSSGDGNTKKGIGEGEAAGPKRRVLAFKTKLPLGEMNKNFLNSEMGDGGCVQAKPNLENKIDTMEAQPKTQSPKDSIGNDVSPINCGPDGKSSGCSGDGNTQKGIGEGEAAGPNRRVLAFKTKTSLGEMYKNFLNSEMGDGGCVQAKPNLENKIDTMEAQPKTQSPKDSLGNDISPSPIKKRMCLKRKRDWTTHESFNN